MWGCVGVERSDRWYYRYFYVDLECDSELRKRRAGLSRLRMDIASKQRCKRRRKLPAASYIHTTYIINLY